MKLDHVTIRTRDLQATRTADANLRLSLILWPAAMILSLVVAGFLAPFKWPFLAAAFVFGIASFANVPPMQMRVMKYGKAAPELAATANISAFNIANALGGLIGGAIVDSSFGASAIPFAAAIVPLIALVFILSQERGGVASALSRPALKEATLALDRPSRIAQLQTTSPRKERGELKETPIQFGIT
jgi:predicted MFS family arabinose efflux permease